MDLIFEALWRMFEQNQSLVLLFGILFLYYDSRSLRKNLVDIEARLAVLIKCPLHETMINDLVEKVDALEVENVQQTDQIESDIGGVVRTVNSIQISITKIDSILDTLNKTNNQLTEIFQRLSALETAVSEMRGTCNERGKHCPALIKLGK